MDAAARLLLAIAISWGCSLAAGILRSWPWGRAASWFGVSAVLACPLLIPSEHVGLRAASACVSADLAFKMVDSFRHRGRDGPAFLQYVRFLVPFPVFAVVYPDLRRRLIRPDRRGPHVLRVLGGLAGVALGCLLARAKRDITPFHSSFSLDHAAMLLLFILAIESLAQVLYGLERLAGYDVTPIIRRAFLSRTVSEFWRRYNRRIHDWFHRHVFLASGGRRHPTRGIVLVFLVSGLFHELMFDVATSKITGYQLAFFLIQAPPALASRRLEHLARRRGIAGRVVAHGLTILFLSAVSVLFFRGVSDVFPFIYASRPPLP